MVAAVAQNGILLVLMVVLVEVVEVALQAPGEQVIRLAHHRLKVITVAHHFLEILLLMDVVAVEEEQQTPEFLAIQQAMVATDKHLLFQGLQHLTLEVVEGVVTSQPPMVELVARAVGAQAGIFHPQ